MSTISRSPPSFLACSKNWVYFLLLCRPFLILRPILQVQDAPEFILGGSVHMCTNEFTAVHLYTYTRDTLFVDGNKKQECWLRVDLLSGQESALYSTLNFSNAVSWISYFSHNFQPGFLGYVVGVLCMYPVLIYRNIQQYGPADKKRLI